MVFTEHINDIMHLHSNMIDQGFKPVRYYVPVIAQLLWCQKTKAKYKEDYVCVWSHCSLLYYIISINSHQDGQSFSREFGRLLEAFNFTSHFNRFIPTKRLILFYCRLFFSITCIHSNQIFFAICSVKKTNFL